MSYGGAFWLFGSLTFYLENGHFWAKNGRKRAFYDKKILFLFANMCNHVMEFPVIWNALIL